MYKSLLGSALLGLCCVTFALIGSSAMAQNEKKDDLYELVKAHNKVGLEIYKRLSSQGGNIVISPIGIAGAMGMCFAASEGDTAIQMQRVLYSDAFSKLVESAYPNFLSKVTSKKHGRNPFTLANAIFLFKEPLRLRQDFVKVAKRSFDAEVIRTSDSSILNDWINKKTSGNIKKLYDKLPQGLDATVISAVHLKGKWKKPFNKNLTKDKPFFVRADKSKLVPTMVGTFNLGVLSTEHFQAVDFPFAASSNSMIIIMPKRGVNLSELESELKDIVIRKVIDRLGSSSQEVHLELPRFDLTFERNLVETFMSLGLSLPFDPARANFGRMIKMSKVQNFFLQEVLHKVTIKVDEDGAEAASLTGIGGMVATVKRPPLKIKINRPFLFLIIDKESGSTLFVGRVIDPLVR